MNPALVYKGKLYVALTHCQAYAKIKTELGREIRDDELWNIKSGFVDLEGVFIKEN